MTIKKSFKTWLVSLGIASSGQIKLTRVPSGRNASNNLWWLLSEGGLTVQLVTGESQTTYQIGIYYRSTDPQAVDQALESLSDSINLAGCLTLSGYDLVSPPITSSPQTDSDLDNEERTVGYLQCQLTVRKD